MFSVSSYNVLYTFFFCLRWADERVRLKLLGKFLRKVPMWRWVGREPRLPFQEEMKQTKAKMRCKRFQEQPYATVTVNITHRRGFDIF